MDELIRQAEEQRRKTQLSQQENDRMEQMADSQRSVGLAVIEGAKAPDKRSRCYIPAAPEDRDNQSVYPYLNGRD